MTKFLIFCIYCVAIYCIYKILRDMIPNPLILKNTIKLLFYSLIALGISINIFKSY
jgi:hypothetical protein